MRKNLPDKIETGRIVNGALGSEPGIGPYGAFVVQGPCGAALHIVAADTRDDESGGWEHVSVSTDRRPPNWQEMCFVKDLFWHPEECVIQYHPPRSQYVNHHPYCLHLWSNARLAIPMPPTILVGP